MKGGGKLGWGERERKKKEKKNPLGRLNRHHLLILL
jgi:hypothetical protein